MLGLAPKCHSGGGRNAEWWGRRPVGADSGACVDADCGVYVDADDVAKETTTVRPMHV